MAQQLIFTSSPRGYHPGASGYCTVGRGESMRAGLVTALEQMSVYAHRPSAPHPLIYSYQNIQLTGTLYRVLTRTRDAGLDFTGRTNFIAHHLVFEFGESFENTSPAEILLDWAGWRSVWDGNSRSVPDLSSSEILGGIAPLAPPCRAWREITGDSGYAASPFSHGGGCWWLHSKRTEEEVLRLMGESLRLLPDQTSESLWATTFTTYVGQILEPNLYQWKGWNQGDDPTKSGVLRGNALDIENPGSLPKGPQELEQIAREGYPKSNTNNLSTSEETRVGFRRIPGEVTASNSGMTSLPDRVGGRKAGRPPIEKLRKSGKTPTGLKHALWILLPITLILITVATWVFWMKVPDSKPNINKGNGVAVAVLSDPMPHKTEKDTMQESPKTKPVQGSSVSEGSLTNSTNMEEPKSFNQSNTQLGEPGKTKSDPPPKDKQVEFTKMIWHLATGSEPIPTLGGSKIVLFDDRTSKELCLDSDVTGDAQIVRKGTIGGRSTLKGKEEMNLMKWKDGDFEIVKEPQGKTQWIIRISNPESVLAIVFSNGTSQTVLLRQGSTHLKIPVPEDAKLEKVEENFRNFTKYITPGSTNKFALSFRDKECELELSKLRAQIPKIIEKDLEEKKTHITDQLTNMAQGFTFEDLKNLSVKKANATSITNFEKFAIQFCTNYSKTAKTGFLTSTNPTKYTTYYEYTNEFMASNVTGTNQATYPVFLLAATNAIIEARANYLLKKLTNSINVITMEDYKKYYGIPTSAKKPAEDWAERVNDVWSKYREWQELDAVYTKSILLNYEQWLTDDVLSENPKYPLEIREGTNVIVRFTLKPKDVDVGIKK